MVKIKSKESPNENIYADKRITCCLLSRFSPIFEKFSYRKLKRNVFPEFTIRCSLYEKANWPAFYHIFNDSFAPSQKKVI